MRDIMKLVENLYDDDREEPDYSDLKPSATIVALRPQIAQAAQVQYDRWKRDDDDEDGIAFQDEFAGGGICHLIADQICEIVGNAGVDCSTVSSSHEVHVYCVAQCRDGVFEIDIPYRTYETGGGYSWKRIEGVVFTPDDVIVHCLDRDPGNVAMYCDREEF